MTTPPPVLYFRWAPIAMGTPIVLIIVWATLSTRGTPRNTFVLVFPLVISPIGYLKPTLKTLGRVRLITPVVLITALALPLHTRTVMGCLLLSTPNPRVAPSIVCTSVLSDINLAHITLVLNPPYTRWKVGLAMLLTGVSRTGRPFKLTRPTPTHDPATRRPRPKQSSSPVVKTWKKVHSRMYLPVQST